MAKVRQKNLCNRFVNNFIWHNLYIKDLILIRSNFGFSFSPHLYKHFVEYWLTWRILRILQRVNQHLLFIGTLLCGSFATTWTLTMFRIWHLLRIKTISILWLMNRNYNFCDTYTCCGLQQLFKQLSNSIYLIHELIIA